MNNDINDFGYTAVRMKSGISSHTIEELFSKAIVTSHKELVPGNLKNLVEKAQYMDISAKALGNMVVSLANVDKCKLAMDEYIQKAEAEGIKAISVSNKEYPYHWRHLSGMPKVLFAKGNTDLLMDAFMSGTAAVVGSRSPSKYSLYATDDFTKQLVKHGVIIVSGLALGIDGQAHRCALNNGGKTIAVTPGGPDILYPYQHDKLYYQIYEKGLVISEMPPGQGIIKKYFPARNRLVSALSDVCLIMEAGRFSGTLHTASYAGNQGKDVFVLPNSVYFENSVGGLMLIRDGAEILIDAETVLERIRDNVIQRVSEDGEKYPELINRKSQITVSEEDLFKKMNSTPELMTSDEWKTVIKSFIEEKPRLFDELAKLIPLQISQLMAYLSQLEFDQEVETDRDRFVLTIQKT